MYTRLLTPADLLFLRQFETHTLPEGGFRHREHVRLTWIYLTRAAAAGAGADAAAAVAEDLCAALLDLATRAGKPERFDRALTLAWVETIEDARRQHPDLPFDAFAAACPHLLDVRSGRRRTPQPAG